MVSSASQHRCPQGLSCSVSPRHTRNQHSRLTDGAPLELGFPGSFLGGVWSQSQLLNSGGGSWKSLPSPAGWRGKPVSSGAASAVADPACRRLLASPLGFCERCRGYRSPAWGCRALKEMFLFMQRCQISYASWHGVTAFMTPCLSLLTPISFYHCAAPWSFSAGFMFQPDCV